jgi:hypothetical protein
MLIFYHALEVKVIRNDIFHLIYFVYIFFLKLFMIDNCLDDWRIAMTWQRVLQIGAEVSSKNEIL